MGNNSNHPCRGRADITGTDRRPHHRRRNHPVLDVIKAISRFLPANGSSLVTLDKTALLNKACKQTGLDDVGDESFLKPLGILLDSFESDARLNLIGRVCVHSDILRMICNRLLVQEDRKRHPEIADQIISRPLFITGLPRTGSTLLHALLARDVTCRAPQVWEVMHPSPAPETSSYGVDSRIAKTGRELKWLDVIMPGFKTVHMIDARLPQECIAICGHSFISYLFESMYFVTSYRAWHDKQDKLPAYEYHKQFLQHLQWRAHGSHWVLKAPSHLLALEALVKVYPDARIVVTHRDPLKVIGSCASFTEVLRGPFTDRLDRKTLGIEIVDRWEPGSRLAIDSRQGNGKSQQRFFDVLYPDLVRQPMEVVRQIYKHFDMELSSESEKAMLKFLAENPRNRNGVHHYSLEDFGLDIETERRRFQPYTSFFGIEPEL